LFDYPLHVTDKSTRSDHFPAGKKSKIRKVLSSFISHSDDNNVYASSFSFALFMLKMQKNIKTTHKPISL